MSDVEYIKEWEECHGKMPPDATHLFVQPVGTIPFEWDLFRAKGDKVYQWGSGGWELIGPWDGEYPPRCIKLNRQKKEEVEIKNLSLAARLVRWKELYGPVPEGATHIERGEGKWKTDVVKIEGNWLHAWIEDKWLLMYPCNPQMLADYTPLKPNVVVFDVPPKQKSKESIMGIIERQMRAAVESVIGWVALVVIVVIACALITGLISASKTVVDYGVRGAAAPIVDAGSAVWYGRKGADAELPQQCTRAGTTITCGDKTYTAE